MEEAQIVRDALKQQGDKMTELGICEATGLRRGAVTSALHWLHLRGLIQCDSFDPSKRGGQAGVRRWGGASWEPLWEAAEELEEGDLDAVNRAAESLDDPGGLNFEGLDLPGLADPEGADRDDAQGRLDGDG